MNKKFLILRRNPNDGLTRELEWCDIKVYYTVKYDDTRLRVSRKLNDMKLATRFFGEWKSDIEKYDEVILFDNGYHKVIAKYIKKYNPDCKVVLWFWNNIFDENKKYLEHRELDEIWSYDKEDCKRYGLRYNTQFFNKDNVGGRAGHEQDVLFVGTNKGRKELVDKVSSEMEKLGIKTRVIMPENATEFLDYKDYLRLVNKSLAILEIAKVGTCGLTLRSLEALFYEKKLITNNSDIASYDFYRPENIFILGKDDMSKIKEFINSPYKKIDRKIVDYYDFENWLKRFEKEKK